MRITLDELMGAGAKRQPRTLPALRPNAGIEARYHRALASLVDQMHGSVVYWVRARYRASPPATMAHDEPAYRVLDRAMKELADRWNDRFDSMAEKLAKYFAQRVSARTDAGLRKILTDGGFMLSDWKMTAAQRDAIGGIVAENVSLIKSIPRQYLGGVEQDVMRSVSKGGDLKTLVGALQRRYGSTRERALLIARHQNASATGKLQRVRFLESGIRQAVWMHSGGGREPRPTHIEAGRRGQVFDIEKGWWDPEAEYRKGVGKVGAYILPGTLINCRCSCRPVLPYLTTARPKAGWAA